LKKLATASLGQAPIAILHPNVRGRERKDGTGREKLADSQMSASGVYRQLDSVRRGFRLARQLSVCLSIIE
jgi:hypothetical protein